MRRLLFLLAVLQIAASTRAEVRLDDGREGASVRISLRRSHAWAPVGRVDARTLNPLGDLRGDGRPTAAVHGSRALVAWSEAGTRDVALALSRGGAWLRPQSIVGARAAGSPQVAFQGDFWTVAWTNSETGSLTVAAVSRDGSLGEAQVVGAGSLEASAVNGDLIYLFAADSAGQLIATVLAPPDQLPPIYRVVRVTRVADAPIAPAVPLPSLAATRNVRLPQDRPVVFRSALGTTWLDADWQAPAGDDSMNEDVSVAVGGSLVAVMNAAKDEALAAWWRDARTLEFVELTEGGVGEVRQVTGRGEFSPSLVHEALRLVGSE